MSCSECGRQNERLYCPQCDRLLCWNCADGGCSCSCGEECIDLNDLNAMAEDRLSARGEEYSW